MLSFKGFLLSETAWNVGITDPDIVPEVVSKKQDMVQLKKFFNYLRGLIPTEEMPLITNLDGKSESGELKIIRVYQDLDDQIKAWLKDNAPDLVLSTTNAGYGNGTVGKRGKKIPPSTQEFMTATLVLLGKEYSDTELSLVDAGNIINDAKEKFGEVEGSTGNEQILDFYHGNFNDLATAISSSNAIFDILRENGDYPIKVYQTGKKWHEDIIQFNPPVGGIKDYNSSDIVVKGTSGVFYGFSLKKKPKSTEVDPTLINKPITGDKSFLKNILGADEMREIETSKERFFDNVIWKHHKKKTEGLGKTAKNKLISEIPVKKMGSYLKDPRNVFFRRVNQVLSNNSEKFCKEFIELLFRTKLNDKLDGNFFKFYLLTGIGKQTGNSVTVEPAETKYLPHTITVLSDIFSSNLKLLKTPNKLNAWEKDAKGKQSTAAKLFFSIISDSDQIIDIEIRYKGSYTANPQFQAVATPRLKTIFKNWKE